MDKVIVIGTGLIGGSIMLDLREHYLDAGYGGLDQSEANVQQAHSNGMIDFIAQKSDFETAELILV